MLGSTTVTDTNAVDRGQNSNEEGWDVDYYYLCDLLPDNLICGFPEADQFVNLDDGSTQNRLKKIAAEAGIDMLKNTWINVF